jgi:outer membrane receptor protein involved in Fe transport
MSRIRDAMACACVGAALLALIGAKAALAQSASTAADRPIEKVVVTAEKKKAAVQDVPIAVTAITGKDLSDNQIESFKDLQFNAPSVTFSKGNFAGNNFQIRGIGVSAVAASADSGVAVHTNNIYQVSTAGLAVAEYFDIDRIEILRGPQSTLYGRNATGGAVNIITNKPNLDEFLSSFEGEYGEFDDQKLRAMVNVPLFEDVLGLRMAGIMAKHDGFVENLHTGNDVDDQDVYSLRGSLRLKPWDSMLVDFMASYFHEEDTHVRSPKQMCHRDPTGVLGCLPDRLDFDPINANATFASTIASQQWWGDNFGIPTFGLFDLTTGPGLGASADIPDDLNTIRTDFEPRYRAQGTLYTLSIEQEIGDWLIATLDLGYVRGKTWSQQNYNQSVGEDISTNISASMATFQVVFGANAAPYVNTYFSSPCGTSCLPLSSIADNSGTGLVGGNAIGDDIVGYFPNVQAYDQIDGSDEEWTGELRFQSDFDGPLNFLIAGYKLDYDQTIQYYVVANTLDFTSIFLGAAVGNFVLGANGLMLAPPTYRNNTLSYELDSEAIFGELYWDIIPDDLKLTIGLRQTKDEKRTVGQTTLFNVYVPIGTEDLTPFYVAQGFDADPSVPGAQLVADQSAEFKATTGRLVLTWTPKVDFTDETLVYASYARGFKSGGINPPLSAGLGGVPANFAPETIDAYEIGAKNTLLDQTLQANVTGWYYEYEDYQVSKIVNRTSVNENISAKLWGLEGEFLYRPSSRWTFNLVLTNTHSEIGEAFSVDQRNVTNGLPGSVWIKDLGTGANCVMVKTSAIAAASPADAGKFGFHNPPGGSTQLAGIGVPAANFGNCANPLYDPANPAGDPDFRYISSVPFDGVAVALEGNELPQTPGSTIAFGAQYTHPVGTGLELSFGVAYYWQSSMWTRIYNRDPIDKIESWGVLNAHVLLESSDGWHAKLFATNLLDDRDITNSYLTDASSGLFTNVFVTDPRIIGIAIGADF